VTKDYDTRFKSIFAEVAAEHADAMATAGLSYRYLLIDAAAASLLHSEGGFLWACKNYEGDVLGDLVASGYGSHAMMTSELFGIDGSAEFEASHGTMPALHQAHLAGEPVYANPCSSAFAWTRGLARRAELDGQPELARIAHTIESSLLEVIDEGHYTIDMQPRWRGDGELTTTTDLLRLAAARTAQHLGA